MTTSKYSTIPIGSKFNRWTVLSYSHRMPYSTSYKDYWLCRCECGTEKPVLAASIVSGRSRSCKCYERDNPPRLRHGHCKPGQHTPEYTAWANMMQRVTNASKPQAKDYIGRGITVCARWVLFDNFLQDMGLRPGKGYSIERRNNDGNYEPDNCYWATRMEQNRNRRGNNWIEWNGERLTATEWARKMNCSRRTLTSRIETGWSIEKTMTTPFSGNSPKWP